MNMGDLIGQMLRQGVAGAPSEARLRNFGAQAQGAGGIEQMLGGLLGGRGGAPAAGGRGGDLGSLLGGLLGGGGPAAGANPLGAILGGLAGGRRTGGGGDQLGTLLGGLLGGGRSAAGGGGAVAVLGTLAMAALNAYAARSDAPPPAPEAAPTLVGGEAERLILRAMIAAAKADGKLDAAEREKLLARAGEGEADPAAAAFVEAEMAAPLDAAAIAAGARTPEQAAQVYAASILAIEIDSEAERAYLRDLAAALNLPAGAVAQLHKMTGAPAV
jgi:uncharacterized membrane protein YebE (DUF533 family)